MAKIKEFLNAVVSMSKGTVLALMVGAVAFGAAMVLVVKKYC